MRYETMWHKLIADFNAYDDMMISSGLRNPLWSRSKKVEAIRVVNGSIKLLPHSLNQIGSCGEMKQVVSGGIDICVCFG